MAALVKGVLLFGVVLLLGVGLFTRVVGRGALAGERRRALRATAMAAAVLIAAAGLVEVVFTLRGVLGFVDRALVIDYLRSTNHGTAVLLRLPLAALLAALAPGPATPRWAGSPRWAGGGDALFALAALALLASFSLISHNAAMGGWFPPVADLIHLATATAWAGSVLLVAFAPAWRRAQQPVLVQALRRVSAIGLAGVALLVASGLYSAWLHVGAQSLTTTPYGWTLLAKIGLVLVILLIAAANRWLFLPALERSGARRGLVWALRLEALGLLAVLAATGLLTTLPVPH